MVRAKGVEPSRPKAPEPKSGASTNSATRASSRGAWPTAATYCFATPTRSTPNSPLGQALGKTYVRFVRAIGLNAAASLSAAVPAAFGAFRSVPKRCGAQLSKTAEQLKAEGN